jgi:hypothetical protein
VAQLILVVFIVGSSLVLVRKLDINGAGLIWFGSSYKYFRNIVTQKHTEDLPSA